MPDEPMDANLGDTGDAPAGSSAAEPASSPAETPTQTPSKTTTDADFSGEEPGWAPGAYARFREINNERKALAEQMNQAREAIQMLYPYYEEAERLRAQNPDAQEDALDPEAIDPAIQKWMQQQEGRISEREQVLARELETVAAEQAMAKLEKQYGHLLEKPELKQALLAMSDSHFQSGRTIAEKVSAVLAAAKVLDGVITHGRQTAFADKKKVKGEPQELKGAPPPPRVDFKPLDPNASPESIRERMGNKLRSFFGDTD